MSGVSARISARIVALAAGSVGAVGCVVGPVVADPISGGTGGVSETGRDPGAHSVTDTPDIPAPDMPDDHDSGLDVCLRMSEQVGACEPAAWPDIVLDVDGFPEPGTGVFIGVADCTIDAIDAAPGLATIELACMHLAGDLIEPEVTVTITSGPPLAASALHVGRAVRFTAMAARPDSHGPLRDFIRLTRPTDGALLLAGTLGAGDLIPAQTFLDEIGLLSTDWYAPLSIAQLGDLCPPEQAECDESGTRERGALSFTVADRAPATLLDHHTGTIDGGYRATVGHVQLYARPYDCVDNQPQSDLVIVADAGCPDPLTRER